MPLITQTVSKEYLSAYDGYNQQKVGLGLITPDIYATPEYSKKKVRNLPIGLVTKAVYSGYDHDPNPLVLPFQFEPRYQTVMGFNLHYVPALIRKNILKYILDSNAARIKANQPIIVNWDSIKRAIPQVRGIVRRYKVVGISPIETYPLVEWPNLLKIRSPYENMYKEAM